MHQETINQMTSEILATLQNTDAFGASCAPYLTTLLP